MISAPKAPLTCQREAFSLPPGLHYLNGAYMSPLSKAVEAAGHGGIMFKTVPTQISPPDFFSGVDDAKRHFAQLVNAPAARIALIPAVSYGIATVAANLDLESGQRIVLLHEQFPSNVYTWRRLQADGIIIDTVQPPTREARGQHWNEAILDAIRPDTAVVALGHVHWADGTKFDLDAISQKTREVGAALVIDGTQSVGALPFDVGRYQPDALICGGYKWLMGPYGLGYAYYGPRFAEGQPLEDNWIARAGSEDFSGLVNYQDDYAPGAARFDVGEKSNPILIPMMIAALGELLERDPARIQDYCRRLTQHALTQLADYGYQLEDDSYRAHHLFGVRLPERVNLDTLKQALQAANVAVSVRGDAVRVSPNIYNDEADIDALSRVLIQVAS
ncbi:MAG: aminotransferase class V-fold PLP-dependent enzyme [Deinococcota bacterium]